jgi:preprotein translocase subunit SecD
MAGVAGIVLFIGMAVDANILFFSRMKEELRSGKGLITSIEDGFRHAISSVRDGNLTTIMVGSIFFFFGTGFLQGFAVTLILGLLISLCLFLFFAKDLLILLARTRLGKHDKLWR